MASKRQRRYRDRRRSGRAPLTEAELERAGARREIEAARPKREKVVAATAGPRDPRGRPVRVPSWSRPLKLAPIFLVFWFVLTRYVTKSAATTTAGAAFQALLLTAVLVPAMYLSDRMAYRIATRRQAKAEAAAAAKRS